MGLAGHGPPGSPTGTAHRAACTFPNTAPGRAPFTPPSPCEASLFGRLPEPVRTENRSTTADLSTMIDVMFRHAFALAASATGADAPKAALLIVVAAADGARS